MAFACKCGKAGEMETSLHQPANLRQISRRMRKSSGGLQSSTSLVTCSVKLPARRHDEQQRRKIADVLALGTKWIGTGTGVSSAIVIALDLGIVVHGFALVLLSSFLLGSVALKRKPSLAVASDRTDDATIAMKPTPEPSAQEVLAGLVERVTYHNAENGFCVLRAKARGHRDVVTVVGHSATIAAGEWITASGEWVNDRTHGQQFKARFLRTSLPDSADGIEKYLSSGMIRGVGPVTPNARRWRQGVRRHRGDTDHSAPAAWRNDY